MAEHTRVNRRQVCDSCSSPVERVSLTAAHMVHVAEEDADSTAVQWRKRAGNCTKNYAFFNGVK